MYTVVQACAQRRRGRRRAESIDPHVACCRVLPAVGAHARRYRRRAMLWVWGQWEIEIEPEVATWLENLSPAHFDEAREAIERLAKS